MDYNQKSQMTLTKAFSIESIVLLVVIAGFLTYFAIEMDGLIHFFGTVLNTSYQLLINTALYIMAIAVVTGAFAGLMTEFGLVALLNNGLTKFMKPLFNLPGAAALGVITTYLSDNPAILTLTKESGFRKYFKKYQLPALTNLGTAFGMGLIVSTFMLTQGTVSGPGSFGLAVLIGNVGAIIGSIISVRLMLFFTKKKYGATEDPTNLRDAPYDILKYREVRVGNVFKRTLDSLLHGGKTGVELGLAIIPGILIISTFVLMLTNGPGDLGYTGAAFEGTALLPAIAGHLNFIIQPLFGFSSPEAIAFPIASIGSVGASLSLVPEMLSNGLIGAKDIAVFTAMGMCFSGYLSTHVAMMDTLGFHEMTGKAILSHTIGGLVAGISANLLFTLILLF